MYRVRRQVLQLPEEAINTYFVLFSSHTFTLGIELEKHR